MPIQIETSYKLDIRHKKWSSFPAWTHNFPDGIPTGTMKLIIQKTWDDIEVTGVESWNTVTYTLTLTEMNLLEAWDYPYEAKIEDGAEVSVTYIYWKLTIF